MNDAAALTGSSEPFHGAKVILFVGEELLVLRRDHTAGIAWPGRLDFPGGGREGDETPEACGLRETREEVGLTLTEDQLNLVHIRRTQRDVSYFFAAHLPKDAVNDVVFGGEGDGWLVMGPLDYCRDPLAIPHFAEILAQYLESKEGASRLVS